MKPKPYKTKKEAFTDSKGKSNTQTPCNYDIKCFFFMFRNKSLSVLINKKRVTVLQDQEVENKCDNNNEEMPPFKDASFCDVHNVV